MASPFGSLPHSPAEHFRLRFYGAVLHLRERVAGLDGALEGFPFLDAYAEEAGGNGVDAAAWGQAVREWEERATVRLPLLALRDTAELDETALSLVFATGLVEEDSRFAALFGALQGSAEQERPAFGLLTGWWDPSGGGRAELRRLLELGLVAAHSSDAPQTQWPVHVPAVLWDAMRGDAASEVGGGARHRYRGELETIDDLVISAELADQLRSAAGALRCGEARSAIVRGPETSGRRTIAAALAHRLGMGVLELEGPGTPDGEIWPVAGALATLMGAMPVLVLSPGPGETIEVPRPQAYAGPLAVVIGRTGGVGGPGAESAITITVPVPGPAERHRHWLAGLEGAPANDLEGFSERFRMTGGNVRRVARLARAEASVAGRDAVDQADVVAARRALYGQTLDTLATRVESGGDWSLLAVAEETSEELRLLEHRCRYRERLTTATGEALRGRLTPGVRALFSGPSGTGKTLAARLLASALGLDMYAVDLARILDMYIGNTEKRLDELFSRAEELDVALLLDEGDSLLTRRTSVQSSNDRYANVQTNYLLHRIESFEGILVVTTNAGERIDEGFQRRMDTVVEFQLPAVEERLAILRLHLPPDHAVAEPVIEEVAARCALAGGQLRNAVLHATVLGLGGGGRVSGEDLLAGVRREYRKAGQLCPMPQERALARA